MIGFSLLRSEVHLLGDGYLRLRELSRLATHSGNGPLMLWLISLAFSLAKGLSAEDTYRLLSYLAGACYLSVSFPVSRLLAPAHQERLIVLSFLMTPGFVLIFCGYVEIYPLLFPGMLLYLLCGFHYLRGNLPLWVCSGVLALLAASHLFLVVLLPSLGTLAFMRLCAWEHLPAADRSTLRSMRGEKWHILGGLALFPLLWFAILAGTGFDVVEYATNLRGNHLLPFWSEPDFFQAYSLLAPAHWLDFINQQLLVAPAVVLVLAGSRGGPGRTWKADQLFLASAGIFPLLFTFLVNPEIGFFRDWDVLSLSALPLVLWAALALIERAPSSTWLSVAGLLICGVTALHTATWLVLNAHSPSAVARYVHLMETSPLSGQARGYGWEVLGAYFRDQGDSEQSLQAFNRALQANPQNWRYWRLACGEHLALGHLPQAVETCEGALALRPAEAEVWDLLGTVYKEQGRYEESIEAHTQALNLDPGQGAKAWFNLGNAYTLAQRFGEAIRTFEKALALDDREPDIHFNLGLVHHATGDWLRAARSYQRTLELDNDYAMAHYRLAQLYYRTGKTERLTWHAQRYLQLAPGVTQYTEDLRELMRKAHGAE